MVDASDRFHSAYITEPNSGCWLWIKGINKGGYSMFSVNGRSQPGHRYSWELHNGTIPTGMHVCHKCDTPSCVNPSHLFVGTRQDNMDDKVRKGRASRLFGQRNPNSKFSESDIYSIRESKESVTSLSKIYGVSDGHIVHIQKRRRWGHLPERTGG